MKNINEKNILRMILYTAIRVIIYSWVLLIIAMRSNELLIILSSNIVFVLIIIVALSGYLTNKKYDYAFVGKILKSEKGNQYIYTIIGAIWILLLIDFMVKIKGSSNLEPFMNYEPIFIVLGFPGSIIGFALRMAFHGIIISENIEIMSLFVWSCYFIPAMIQTLLIIRYLRHRTLKPA